MVDNPGMMIALLIPAWQLCEITLSFIWGVVERAFAD